MAAYGQSSFGIVPPQPGAHQAQPHPPPPQSIEKPIVSIINNAKPILMALLKAADAAGPILAQGIRQGRNLWAAIQPYHPQDWFPIFFGLTLIFFGGQFPVLLAAVEAFRICGWQNTKRAILLIWDQFQIALEASKKDDLLDENKDGIADVLQIQGSELVSRKVMLFFRCTDPKSLNEGVQGLAAGCSAVIATLRLHFAQTLTLGVSLGDVFTRTADQVLRPALEATMPKEQHKWIGMTISYGCRSVAVTIAWWCTRIISAMHSATRGAQMVILGINLVARRYNVHIPFDLTELNPAYPIICGSLAGLGLYTQIMRGFSLPFPLNILLLPVRLLEWILYYVLAYHGLYTNN